MEGGKGKEKECAPTETEKGHSILVTVRSPELLRVSALVPT